MLTVRGPLTAAFLRHLGVERPIDVVGDPGLLVQADNRVRPLAELPIEDRSQILAVNLGYLNSHLENYGTPAEVYEQLTLALQQLAAHGFELVLYPVWPEDLPLQYEVHETLLARGVRAHRIECVHRAATLVAMLGECHRSLNLKLHANVLSGTAATPAIMLGYGFKTFDFAASVGLSDLVVSTGAPELGHRVLDLAQRIDANWPQPESWNQTVHQTRQRLTDAVERILD